MYDCYTIKDMNKLAQELEEQRKPILDPKSLPDFEYASKVLKRLHPNAIPTFLKDNNMRVVFNKEMVEGIEKKCRELKTSEKPILEMYAGRGELTYHLRQRGLDVIAIDDFSKSDEYDGNIKRLELVENMDFSEAIAKYQPEILITCIAPIAYEEDGEKGIGYFLLPPTKAIIDIGTRGGMFGTLCSGTLNLIEKTEELGLGDDKIEVLSEIERFILPNNIKNKYLATLFRT